MELSRIAGNILIIIIGILGVILNGTTLIVILRKVKISPQYMLIINILLSDMLMSISQAIGVVGILLEVYSQEKYGITFLAIYVSPFIITCFSLLLITCQHYILILYPLHAPRYVTKRNTRYAIIVSWVLASVPDIVFAIKGGYVAYDGGKWKSDIFSMVKNFVIYYWHYAYLPVMYVTIVLFVFAYGRILWERRRSLRQNPEHRSGEQRRSLNTSLFILGTFLASYVPFCAFATYINYILPQQEFNRSLYLFTRLLRNFNSICDPLIYAIRLNMVKQAFQKLCRCCKCLRPPQSPRSAVTSSTEMSM